MARPKSLKSREASSPVRKQAVAGIFYPEAPGSLADVVDGAFDRQAKRESFLVVVAPHGGSPASVQVTGKLFSRLKPCRSALVLGPSHTGLGQPFAIFPAGVWETGLGKLPVDQPLAQALTKARPDLTPDVQAHEQEHAVEVILPFLKRICSLRSFVPLLLQTDESAAEACLDKARDLGRSIAQLLRGFQERIPLVVSTNLSQYEQESVAQSRDRQALERLNALDEEGLIQDAADGKVSMCGLFPAAVGMVAAKGLGAREVLLIERQISRPAEEEGLWISSYAGIAMR